MFDQFHRKRKRGSLKKASPRFFQKQQKSFEQEIHVLENGLKFLIPNFANCRFVKIHFPQSLYALSNWSHSIPRLRAVDEKCLSPTAEPRTKH